MIGAPDAVASSEPVSPELALIDPELAKRARAAVCEPAAFRPAKHAVSGAHPLYGPPGRERLRAAGREQGDSASTAPAFDPAPRWTPQDVTRAAASPTAASHRVRWRGHGSVAAATAALAVCAGLLWTLQERSERQTQVALPVVTRQAETPPPPAIRPADPARPAARARAFPAGEVKTLAWAPAEGAVGYEVQLFRGSERVLVKVTRDPRLSLRAAWRYEGRIVVRENGTYRWYVWPLLPGNRRGAAAIVQARIVIASGV